MAMLNRIKPQNMNHLTMMAKTYEKEDNGTETTEGETTDHSEDPLSSESGSLTNWDAGVEIPIIESSLRKMRVSAVNETPQPSDALLPRQRSCLKTEGGRKRRRALLQQHTGEMRLRLPMCSTPLHKPRCISFNPSVMVRQFKPVKVNHRHQKESLWYQEDDYSRMGKKCQRIAQQAMRYENHDGGDHHTLCTRGLENFICPSQRRDNKLEGWASVFDEQEKQQSQGYFDEEKIRLVYQAVSSESLIEAQRRGMADEEDEQPRNNDT